MSRAPEDCSAANQRHLTAALATVRQRLERLAEASAGEEAPAAAESALPPEPGPPPALERLTLEFALSAFERDLLLLAAGPDLDPAFGPLCASLQGHPDAIRPTFHLARVALPGAHWSALAAGGPLRLWRLLETDPAAGPFIGPLWVAERVLLYLAGVAAVEPWLAGRVEAVAGGTELTPGHRATVERIAGHWRQAGGVAALPVIELGGVAPEEAAGIAAAACAVCGLGLYRLPIHALPAATDEVETLRRLWEREATLASSALLIDASTLAPDDAARSAALAWFLEETWGGLLVIGDIPRRLRRPVVPVAVPRPTGEEQRQLWLEALGKRAGSLDGAVEALASQFRLGPGALRAACDHALGEVAAEVGDGHAGEPDPHHLAGALWRACRVAVRPSLPGLAQRIESAVGWGELVLPDEPESLLRRMAREVRHRRQVLEGWGFAAGGRRGLGISALFSGPSGTGKTLAAEVLAHELGLDLYRIDLSAVVSKYIGETEKNLARLFDAAEQGAAILLFDEADALFGKRSEVKDSHDRYANQEVSYLLQRMESYSGLAILTTNLKSNLDPAFLRRLRFIVRFPFPDVAERLAIWQRVLPAAVPRRELNLGALARLNISGAHIRNIALTAAYAAAAAGRPLSMGDLVAAARIEYAKLEKTMPDLGRTF